MKFGKLLVIFLIFSIVIYSPISNMKLQNPSTTTQFNAIDYFNKHKDRWPTYYKKDPNGNYSIKEGVIPKLTDNVEDIYSPKGIVWEEVKKSFNDPNLGDKLVDFYHSLRYRVLFTLVRKTLEKYYDKCDGKEFEIQGVHNNFETKCAQDKKSGEKGKFKCFSFGSATKTSDIDLNVDYTSIDNPKISSFEKLFYVARFISYFNTEFGAFHGDISNRGTTNSLLAYDLNLYSTNVGNVNIATSVQKLNKAQKNLLDRTNRLSVAMLLFNDAIQVASGKKANLIDQPTLTNVQNQMKALGDKNTCVKFINTKQTMFARRQVNPIERNAEMQINLKKASMGGIESLEAICYLVAQNFFANEAYVPTGSIYDIMISQKALPATAYSLSANDLSDSILMNLAYGIEHYYEHNEDCGKFGKYFSRIMSISAKPPCITQLFDGYTATTNHRDNLATFCTARKTPTQNGGAGKAQRSMFEILKSTVACASTMLTVT